MTIATDPAALTDLVLDAYRDALGDPGLDRDSDFFEAGGDSLAAFQITDRLSGALGVEVAVALVFTHPSPAELAEVVAEDLAAVR